MHKEIIAFSNIDLEKHKFHQHKNPISVYDVNINRIVVSNMVHFGKKGFKYFICYKDSKKVRSLCVILPRMSSYRRDFDETRYLSFSIKNDELLAKYYET